MGAVSAPDSLVHLEISRQVAYLRLNRPPLNVLSIAVLEEFQAALQKAERQTDLVALVVRGEGKAFSAGADVGEHRGEQLPLLLKAFHGAILGLLRFPAPTVAVAHGAALGGGLELLIACDMAIADETARLGVPEIKLGVFPPVATLLLPPRIGWNRAAEMVLCGEPLNGVGAERIGLINRAVPSDQLETALEELLEGLRQKSAASLRLARRAMWTCLGESPEAALTRLEHLQLQELPRLADAEEGLRAFLEKRTPVWSHR